MLMAGVITFGCPSIKALAEEIGRRTSEMEPGEWLQGGGWIESQFIEKRMPTKYDLDPYSPNNPVVLERIFSTCCANSAAQLQQALGSVELLQEGEECALITGEISREELESKLSGFSVKAQWPVL